MRAARAAASGFAAAVREVDPSAAVQRAARLTAGGATLEIGGQSIDTSSVRRLVVLAAGKAAPQMVAGLSKVVSGWDGEKVGHLVTKHGHTSGVPVPEWCGVTEAGHPVPDEAGVAGTLRILELARAADESDLVVALVSGGGSALLTAPGRRAVDGSCAAPGVDLEAMQATTRALLASGASIDELNAVRAVLDGVKGGGLAMAAWPARLVTLLLSDVVGDGPSVIASGPTILPGRPGRGAAAGPAASESGAAVARGAAALTVLRSRGLLAPGALPPAVVAAVEATVASEAAEPAAEHGERTGPGTAGPSAPGAAPGGGGSSAAAKGGPGAARKPSAAGPDAAYGAVDIVASNAIAAAAFARACPGYEARLLTTRAEGEAEDLARLLVRMGRQVAEQGDEGWTSARAPCVLVAAGETTVTVPRGAATGAGGRNQHMALAAALELEAWELAEPGTGADRVTFLAAGTDGTDGPTDAAGGIVTSLTAGRARASGVDPAEALARFDSNAALRAAGVVGDAAAGPADGLLVTGPTGTNVMDIYAVFVEAPAGAV
ncbi:hypothetical protein FNF31_03181 [Cafeteria roenbergensis]|uniref:MOFRL-associated domain-containing protein n=1 Tax=Cafeteria roenbergensis TaxID=33653 RepID=A0A5A8DAZ6_CAFRO|nr:hypothetical protein FNF31_03181 [Cafeteria roenbergensis]KAA0170695.1 hypothetical protein FNF28_01239 [Cafeteria roenbergensis]